jgi:hypothetical protein
MHGFEPLSFLSHGDQDRPAKRDGRSREARELRSTRALFLAEFPAADEGRLRECVVLAIAIKRIEADVLKGDRTAIATVAKLSNRLQTLRRELGIAAKQRECANA